jgi:hypothetical protein
MNINNLRKVQLHGARVVTDGGHIAIHSASRAYGFGSPPAGFQENTDFTAETATKLDPAAREFVDDPVSLASSRAMLALPSLDYTTHQIVNDARLSPAGRAEKLKEPRVAAIKTIATVAAEVGKHGQTLRAREAQFYAPPKLTNDVQAGLEDREVRDHWRALPVGQRMSSLEGMARGQDDRTLEALVRSPVAMEPNERELIRNAWVKTAEKRKPKEAAELKAAVAVHEWADSVVKAAAQYSARATGLTPAEITEAARGTGGEGIFFNSGLRAVDAA